MSVFSITITTVLNNYKGVLRRCLPAGDANDRIENLALQRKYIQHAQDVELYYKAINVVEDAKLLVKGKENSKDSYIGVEDFIYYLKNLLSEYFIARGKVIHGKQSASRAVVEAIQLVAQPVEKVDETVTEKLYDCVEIVATYGSSEQYEMLHSVFQKKLASNIRLFEPLLLKLRRKSSG